jgi:hypothetical protein
MEAVGRRRQNGFAPCDAHREREMTQELSNRSNKLFRWTIWTAGAVALVYLIVEHRPHLLGWIPYLIILACPLTHFFMHRRHGGHDGRRDPGDPSSHNP